MTRLPSLISQPPTSSFPWAMAANIPSCHGNSANSRSSQEPKSMQHQGGQHLSSSRSRAHFWSASSAGRRDHSKPAVDRSCALANDAHPFARCLLDNPDYETDDGLKLAPVYGASSL